MLYHSKERIKSLGEVFTPLPVVDEMLNLLAKDNSEIWADDQQLLFDPCCGTGNIITQIYKRRLDAFFEKNKKENNFDPVFNSVIDSLKNLCAVDICEENIKICRYRLFKITFEFLEKHLNVEIDLKFINSHKSFFAHLVAYIQLRIHCNEMLSSLSDAATARANAYKTKAGGVWFEKYGHKPIDFDAEPSFSDFLNAVKLIENLMNPS
jgi:hypothetical protein